jgi:hypothetical protein
VKYYRKIDANMDWNNTSSHAIEGKQMRMLMKSFERHKRRFRKDYPDIKMDLPEPLQNLTIDGKVDQGEITITK